MEIKKNNINSYNLEEIYENYKVLFTDINNAFSFLHLDDAFYLHLVLDEINKSKMSYKGSPAYEQYISSAVKDRLKDIITEQLNNDDTRLTLLNDFINFKFIRMNSYREAYESFNLLNNFLKSVNFVIEPDLMVNLIKNNEIIRNMLGFVFRKYSKSITSGNTSSVFSNDTLILAVEMYCDLENVEINDETLDNLDFEEKIPDDLTSYLNAISSYSLLSKEEEKELGRRIASGDELARKKLATHNLKLVVKVAKLYKTLGELGNLTLMDLIQEGNIGLMRAVDKYDYNVETKFSTYATWWIRQAIIRSVADKSRNIRLPVYLNEKMSKFKKTYRDLEQSLGRTPNISEVARSVGISLEQAIRLDYLKDDTVSLDEVIQINSESDDCNTIVNLIADDAVNIEDSYCNNEIKEGIQKLIDSLKLNEKELFVLRARFGFIGGSVMTLEEIGRKLGVSKERVRQIESRIFNKIYQRPKQLLDLSIFLNYPEAGLRKVDSINKIAKTDSNTSNKSINKKLKQISDNPRNIRVDSIYEYFKKYSNLKISDKEVIDSVLYKEIVSENAPDNYVVPKDVKDIYSRITVQDCDCMMDLLKDPDINAQFVGLKTYELMMVLLRYGYINNKGFSITTISQFLGFSYTLTTNILKNALVKYQTVLYNLHQNKRIRKKDENKD